jgi:uncharacterized protein (DUF488 family)
MTVFTIGYEGLNISEFTALLVAHGVDTVIDVRELPLSRKQGFSKRALAAALEHSGLGYVHMVELGCPKPIRDQHRRDGDWVRYTSGYLKHLKGQDTAIARLADFAASSNCALMCYEADHNDCHRSMVADALARRSSTGIKHIRASGVRTGSAAPRRVACA